jgi:hypothetical protein
MQLEAMPHNDTLEKHATKASLRQMMHGGAGASEGACKASADRRVQSTRGSSKTDNRSSPIRGQPDSLLANWEGKARAYTCAVLHLKPGQEAANLLGQTGATTQALLLQSHGTTFEPYPIRI